MFLIVIVRLAKGWFAFAGEPRREGGLPFELRHPRYNAETEAARREGDEMLVSGNYKTYSSAQALHEAILSEYWRREHECAPCRLETHAQYYFIPNRLFTSR